MKETIKKAIFLTALCAGPATWGCATCGLTQSFTPLMFIISTGFFFMPLFFAAFIGWRIYRDAEQRKVQNADKPQS